MKIFLAGATGAIGRPLVPALLAAGHEVIGTTRSPDRAVQLTASGATAIVCDVYDSDRVQAVMQEAQPDVLINELTDLPQVMDRSRLAEFYANNDRVRTIGGDNLLEAAIRTGVRRVVMQSVAFMYMLLDGDDLKTEESPARLGRALTHAEQAVLGQSGLEAVVLRYGYFYGPNTYAATIEQSARQVQDNGLYCFIHVDDGAAATAAIITAAPGIYNVVDDTWQTGRRPAVSNEKLKRATGWEPHHPALPANG